jgi:hypothetical protein
MPTQERARHYFAMTAPNGIALMNEIFKTLLSSFLSFQVKTASTPNGLF